LDEEQGADYRVAEARLLRARGESKASRHMAQQLLDEGLQPQEPGFAGACMLALVDLPVNLLGDGVPLPFWVEMERHRWQLLSPKPDQLVRRAEALGHEHFVACAWLVATESWLRLEHDEHFQSSWRRADEYLQRLPAPRLLPRLELLAVIGHLRGNRDGTAWQHLERGRAGLMPDQDRLRDRLVLWSVLFHLRQNQFEEASEAIQGFQGTRQKSLLLGHWAGQAALAWAQGNRLESRERLVRFAVADEQLAVGSLSALGFLLWLADASETDGATGDVEAALRSALRSAGRSGLARTVAELDDRLRELDIR